MIDICIVSWMSAFIRCNGLLQYNKPEIMLSACRRLIEVVSEACCYALIKFFISRAQEPTLENNMYHQL